MSKKNVKFFVRSTTFHFSYSNLSSCVLVIKIIVKQSRIKLLSQSKRDFLPPCKFLKNSFLLNEDLIRVLLIKKWFLKLVTDLFFWHILMK